MEINGGYNNFTQALKASSCIYVTGGEHDPFKKKKESLEDDAAGALLLHGLRWMFGRGLKRQSALRGYDIATDEILIDEHALMRLIMIANPAQEVRKLRLVRD